MIFMLLSVVLLNYTKKYFILSLYGVYKCFCLSAPVYRNILYKENYFQKIKEPAS